MQADTVQVAMAAVAGAVQATGAEAVTATQVPGGEAMDGSLRERREGEEAAGAAAAAEAGEGGPPSRGTAEPALGQLRLNWSSAPQRVRDRPDPA